MIIQNVEFIGSFERLDQCPQQDLPEYAFIGRSNVGKSSLINMLTDHKNLAHTSSTPGKTQLFNFFLINDGWHLVDLPGIGYARVSKKLREKWQRRIHFYFKNRMQLSCAFYLVDSNVPPQKTDTDFINLLGKLEVPFVIVFTKTDKKKGKRSKEDHVEAFKQTLLKDWASLPQTFISSSVDSTGREEMLSFIESVNQSLME